MALRCPHCGSDKIVANAKMLDLGQYSGGKLQIAVDENPEALLFKHRVAQVVNARVCGDCGVIQLVAENPGLLYQAYLDSLERY